jgi:hypothetical protein
LEVDWIWEEVELEQKVIVVLVVIHTETGKKVALVGDPRVETGRQARGAILNWHLVKSKIIVVIGVLGEL